jgi:Methane oxygenase PmoA
MTKIPIAGLVCVVAMSAASVELQQSGHQIEVKIDGKPFTTYFFDPAIAKPYLMPLRTASGVVVTRGFPVGNDVSAGNPKDDSFEPHQRPLYFGHGNLDGLDFWGEEAFNKYYTDHSHQGYGHVVLKDIEQASEQRIRAHFTLNTPHNRVIGEETQSFKFDGDAQTRLIDCDFVLTATAGPLDVGDTKEGTFAIRVAPELSAPLGHMINSNGAQGEKAIWGKPANWVDYSGKISGMPVDIAVFDSPKSFRHPTTWHARAYGLFAANPFGIREFTKDPNKDGSWAIPEGKSILFRYRVLIHEGKFDADRIRQAYEHYAAEER